MDSHYRSLAKTASWRVFGTLINSLVIWAIAGKAGIGAIVALVNTAIKMFVYYAHERAWNRIRFGRAESPEYEI